MRLEELRTPALILDRAILERNLRSIARRVEGTGTDLRPHLKTGKSATIAQMATAGQSGGITVSTLAEARYFADHGLRDITYAVGMVPSKMAAAAEIRRDGVELTLLTDHPAAAEAIAAKADELSTEFRVLIEVDCGAHRGGVEPGSPELMEIARRINEAKRLSLAGVLTHAGHAYYATSVDAVKRIAESERRAVVDAAKRLTKAGLPCSVVSAGSTPTAVHGESVDGLTEIRPGVYMFFDLDQFGLGSCEVDDIALTVLTSVIGHQPKHNRLNIDAGSLALSEDQSAGAFLPSTGFGWIMDVTGRHRLADLHVAHVNQEHGLVTGSGQLPFDDLPIGTLLRVLPNHACITAAAYDRYHVVDGSTDPGDVVDTWDRVNGW